MTDLNCAPLREPAKKQEIRWFESIVGSNYWKNKVISLIPSELILLNLTAHTIVTAGFQWHILETFAIRESKHVSPSFRRQKEPKLS